MLTVDEKRFRETFERYSEIGATEDGGLHRLTLTDADKQVRNQFVDDLDQLGLDVRIDRLGNIFGRREGANDTAAPVLIGSHLDSQPYGGRYDGQLGVLTALETLRLLDDQDITTERPIAIVNWTNEEGSRFPHAMLGSAVFTDNTTLDTALSLTDQDDIQLGDELERIGYVGEHPVESFDIHSHLELHIEQGPKLDEHGTSVGIVDGVFGMAWLRATVHGETDHAGPTPMHMRQDAMATAADAISVINNLPTRLSADAISTVGEFQLSPNSVNVIPDVAEFTVDVRSYDDAVVQKAIEQVGGELETACQRHGTSFDLEKIWQIPSTEFSVDVRETLDAQASSLDIAYEHLVSGAGHDAKYINEITPTAMVFVPSVDGKTHNESEFTEWDDCVAGANVFANAALSLAND